MRILILGGDGYLGWPTAMHLTAKGHEVAIADSYLKRRLCAEENVESLFDAPDLHKRVKLWQAVSGFAIRVFIGDLTDWCFIEEVFQNFTPDGIVHYAEMPSAPYSMLNRRAAALTLQNNLGATANVIFAIKNFCPMAHLVKLGTMGEYGTPDIDIEEGWLRIEHKGRHDRFLYPRQSGSLYHTTKVMDTDLLWLYVRVWGLAVTDLMQGPVYGFITDENEADERLFPFFNYDEIFGTVLNRFVVQAVAGHPLTVYGRGGQTKGYLNIKDTLNCVRLALENPAQTGELRIFNQFVETFSVNALAEKVQRVGKQSGMHVEIRPVANPRKEAEAHYYNPACTGLLELGLKPNYLTDDVLAQMIAIVRRHKAKINKKALFRGIRWG